MKKLLARLRSRCGETLIETLAAVLVFTLASLLLFSMISAATDINRRVREENELLGEELLTAEKKDRPAPAAETVTVWLDTERLENWSVTLYRMDADALYSYSPR